MKSTNEISVFYNSGGISVGEVKVLILNKNSKYYKNNIYITKLQILFIFEVLSNLRIHK